MRRMKGSGVEWIGDIPEDWDIIPTKFLFDIISGATPKSDNPDYFDGDIPWITPADFKTEDKYVVRGKRNLTEKGLNACSASLVPPKSIIFSKRAPIGLVAISKNELSTNQGCLACVPKKEIDVFYFYYLMSACKEHYEILGAGTTFKEISASVFARYALLTPNCDEQRAIVCFLDNSITRINALISNNESQIERLKQYKQSLITETVTRGLDQDAPMKDSGVEWVAAMPAHWKSARIKDVIFPKEKPVQETDEIITCFRDGEVTLRKMRREDGFTLSDTEYGYHGVDSGDLVIHGMDAFAGAVGCSDSRGKTTPVVHVCDTAGNNRYYMYYLRFMAYGNILMDLSNGVRQRSSDYRNFARLGVYGVVVPPVKEQDAIVSFLDEKCSKIDAVISLKQRKIERLKQYRHSLIYECVTGKLDLRQGQQEVS